MRGIEIHSRPIITNVGWVLLNMYSMKNLKYVPFYSDKHCVKDLDKASSSLGR